MAVTMSPKMKIAKDVIVFPVPGEHQTAEGQNRGHPNADN